MTEAPSGATRIYYFTGTGNSLHVARKLAAHIENSSVEPMSRLAKRGGSDEPEDLAAVGFVFPVYFDRIPDIVRTAIAGSLLPTGAYLFAVSVSGEPTGNAVVELGRLLQSKGLRLGYGLNVALADNSIIMRTSPETTERRFAEFDEQVGAIADSIRARSRNDYEAARSTRLAVMGPVNRFGFDYLYQARQRTVDEARCSRCGLCVKLCPVGNIVLTDGVVSIGSDCQLCFACLNWCPDAAIRFGRIDPHLRGQYQCQGMKASDIRGQRAIDSACRTSVEAYRSSESTRINPSER